MALSLLFYRINISDVIEASKERLKEIVRELKPSDLKDDNAAEKVVRPLLIDVPVLDEANKYATTRDVSVDVSRDPQRLILDRSRPVYIPGKEITVSIPFHGEPQAFDIRPNSYEVNPPAGEIHGHELRFVYEIVDPSPNINANLARAISQVNKYLDWMRPSAEEMKRELTQLAQSLISERKRRAAAQEQIVSQLGIPIRQQTSELPEAIDRLARKRTTSGTTLITQPLIQWDVFISHASEDKDAIARPLAEALRLRGLRVWYDEFSLRVGDSLRKKIDQGLAASRYGVVIISRHFFEKHWPEQELNGLAGREVAGEKVILPVWHGVTVDDVRQFSPTLADRVAVSTERGLPAVVDRLIEAIK